MRSILSHAAQAVPAVVLAVALSVGHVVEAQPIPQANPAGVSQKALIIPGQGTILTSDDKASFHPGMMPTAPVSDKDYCKICNCCKMRGVTYEKLKKDVLKNKEPMTATEAPTESTGFRLDPKTQESYRATSSVPGVHKWTGEKTIYEIDVPQYQKHIKK